MDYCMAENVWEEAPVVLNKKIIAEHVKPRKGTTTLAFIFKEGIVIAVDSRATAGTYIASQTVNKVIEINKYLLGTMAGGAADCFYWEKLLGLHAKKYELENGKRISVSAAARFLSNSVYKYRKYGLSMSTMVCGYDGEMPKIYNVTNEGNCVECSLLSVGSGSTIAYGILSARYKQNMSREEALELGKDAIFHAGHRDAASGGSVNLYFMNHEGAVKIGNYDFDEIRDAKNIRN
ncbi:20S proteasome subunit beta 5 [Pancytospora epiphaga]|nr:20S proteasome subunit beta 5 [Pancytospora epiphaga]